LTYNSGMNTSIFHPKTLVQAVNHFADLDNAHAFFVKARWGNRPVTCPRCGSAEIHFMPNQRRWECKGKHPKRQFSVKVGSVMEDSPMGLDKWAVAVWLEANSKNSISSYELHRALGITQKSAWFMLHRIRLALKSGSFDKMGGSGSPVESDETFVGGLSKNMHLSRRRKTIHGALGGKTPVMGLLERHSEKGKSKVRAAVIGGTGKEHLYPIIHKNVERGSTIFTDAWRAYRQLPPDFMHYFVDHMESYVMGQIHTNGIENFWSLFKRCIKGTHISVDPAHLQAYVDSEAFRFNHRDTNDGGRFKLAAPGMFGKRLTYKALIGAMEQPPETSGPGQAQA
jgi:transposase-like protein